MVDKLGDLPQLSRPSRRQSPSAHRLSPQSLQVCEPPSCAVESLHLDHQLLEAATCDDYVKHGGALSLFGLDAVEANSLRQEAHHEGLRQVVEIESPRNI